MHSRQKRGCHPSPRSGSGSPANEEIPRYARDDAIVIGMPAKTRWHDRGHDNKK